MKKVGIVVEGSTEEKFVKEVLSLYLYDNGIFFYPVIVQTRKERSGRKFKGGIAEYGKVKNDILKLLHDTSFNAVTTMIDYYALPSDFPGMQNLPDTTPHEKAAHIEKHFSLDINNNRFIPYLSLHEFESLLFSSVGEIKKYFSMENFDELDKAVKTANNDPEIINGGDETHPSRRLEKAIPGFSKTIHGISLTKNIGMPTMLERCKKFNAWVNAIKNL